MEASITHPTTSSSSSYCASQNTKPSMSPSLPFTGSSFRVRDKPNHRPLGLSTRCAKLEPISVEELGKELESDQMNPEGEDWMKRCKERRGIVEMLECLEREAIMGEDEGREPIDYNRRAQIFDKSSRVFQSLKESTTPTQ